MKSKIMADFQICISVLLKKVFFYAFCQISKNTFFHRTPLVAASVFCFSIHYMCDSSIACLALFIISLVTGKNKYETNTNEQSLLRYLNIRHLKMSILHWKYFRIGSYSFITVVSTETAARRCSVKTVFLEISQNSQENICARVSF